MAHHLRNSEAPNTGGPAGRESGRGNCATQNRRAAGIGRALMRGRDICATQERGPNVPHGRAGPPAGSAQPRGGGPGAGPQEGAGREDRRDLRNSEAPIYRAFMSPVDLRNIRLGARELGAQKPPASSADPICATRPGAGPCAGAAAPRAGARSAQLRNPS